MGTLIIFFLVTILAAAATFSALRNKNILGIAFGSGTLLVFGFFAVATLLKLPTSLPQ